MSTKVNPTIQTKWGKANVWNTGYYTISDNSKGHYKELLHRLIFEDFYKIKLPSNIIVHHDDGNKLNNEIWNLIPLTKSEHNQIHHQNNLHRRGKHLELKSKFKISNNKNTNGFYCISIKKCSSCSKGFIWAYQYYDENMKHKSIYSVDLIKLMNKVIDKGLIWKIMDISNAKKTAEKYGYNLEELMYAC